VVLHVLRGDQLLVLVLVLGLLLVQVLLLVMLVLVFLQGQTRNERMISYVVLAGRL
jgi:hypothetical protein